MGVNINILK